MINTIQQQNTKGAAMLLFVIFFLFSSITLTYSISRGVYSELQVYRLFADSKQSYLVAISANEDMAYRYVAGLTPDATEVFTFASTTATSTVVYDSGTDTYSILSKADQNSAIRASEISLVIGVGASFNFGLQTGTGGILMENTSSVQGNVFSNGTVVGANSNVVYGDIISSGPAGIVDNVTATGSVWANTVSDSDVTGTVYYENIDAYTLSNSGAAVYTTGEQATATLPISDELIDEWKAAAEAGGVIASTDPECGGGEYIINSDTTIGPVKIECDLMVDKNSTDLYLQGPIWVTGNINTKSSPDIHVDASITGMSVPIIADNPLDYESSSQITLENQAAFSGHGDNSYILLISQNTSSENGGGETAIHLKNSAQGDILLYAAHGKMIIENSASLKEATAHFIHLKNSAEVIYESGLVNLLFTSGPGGGFVISSWNEAE